MLVQYNGGSGTRVVQLGPGRRYTFCGLGSQCDVMDQDAETLLNMVDRDGQSLFVMPLKPAVVKQVMGLIGVQIYWDDLVKVVE